ncbi:MAG: FkbM family methyltransferase [Neomegalonema sp.]|nr:FkbM family methyltransferase [Neomegalonema sp.]
MSRLMRSLAKRRHRLWPRPRVAERFGARWLLDPADGNDLNFLSGKEPEPRQRAAFSALIAHEKPVRFIDCGANAGLYSVLLGLEHDFEQGIDAFEPVKATHARLVANLWLNGLTAKARAHHCALGAQTGEAEINLMPAASGRASIMDRFKGGQSETIQIRRLDDLLKDEAQGRALAIKIDVEGAEMMVIEGMQNVLRAHDCILQIEAFNNALPALQERMSHVGYREIGRIESDSYFAAENRASVLKGMI